MNLDLHLIHEHFILMFEDDDYDVNQPTDLLNYIQKSQRIDAVKYSVFFPQLGLENLSEKCGQIIANIRSFTVGYVWNIEKFNLQPMAAPSSRHKAPYLSGKISFGDNILDEWFLIAILFRITSVIDPTAYACVEDDDGQVLLIEAAEFLPEWVEDDVMTNRVWIHAGKTFIIPPCVQPLASFSNHIRDLTAEEALSSLSSQNLDCLANLKIQTCIQAKIQPFSLSEGGCWRQFTHKFHRMVPASISSKLTSCTLSRVIHVLSNKLHTCKDNGISVQEMVNAPLRTSRFLFAKLTYCHDECELNDKLICAFNSTEFHHLNDGGDEDYHDGDNDDDVWLKDVCIDDEEGVNQEAMMSNLKEFMRDFDNDDEDENGDDDEFMRDYMCEMDSQVMNQVKLSSSYDFSDKNRHAASNILQSMEMDGGSGPASLILKSVKKPSFK